MFVCLEWDAALLGDSLGGDLEEEEKDNELLPGRMLMSTFLSHGESVAGVPWWGIRLCLAAFSLEEWPVSWARLPPAWL